MDERFIGEKLKNEQLMFSEHALHKMDVIGVSAIELTGAMANGEIIEDYPEDERGHSCLFLCKAENAFIHAVLGKHKDFLFVITVYRPTPDKFLDERTRRR